MEICFKVPGHIDQNGNVGPGLTHCIVIRGKPGEIILRLGGIEENMTQDIIILSELYGIAKNIHTNQQSIIEAIHHAVSQIQERLPKDVTFKM